MHLTEKDIFSILETRGVYLTAYSNNSTFSRGKGAEKYLRMIYINSGKGYCVVDGKEYYVTDGNAVFLREGQKISIYNSINGSIFAYCIVCNKDALEIMSEDFVETVFGSCEPIMIPGMYLHQLRRIIRGFLGEQSLGWPYQDFVIKSGSQTILVQMYRLKKGVFNAPDEDAAKLRAENVIEYMKLHYYDHFTLEEVAHMARMSSRHFSTLLNEITGKTFINYLNDVRVENAKDLVSETDMSISSIAFHTGFEELSSFYRAFKKRYNVPPLQFRKSRGRAKICN